MFQQQIFRRMAHIKAISSTTCFEIRKINELESIDTPEFMVQGIPWHVEVVKHLVAGQQCLGVILYCDKKGTDWLQPAWFSVKLLSFSANVAAIENYIQPCIFYSTTNGFGIVSLIKWDDLFEVNKGYVKENTIKLDIHVEVANPDDGIKSNLIFVNTEKCCAEACLVKYRLTVTNTEHLMAVRTPKIVLRNIPCCLTVCKLRSGFLSVYLQLLAENTISCNITMTVKLISKNAAKSIEKIVNKEVRPLEIALANGIVSWSELVKADNGFIENGSINIEIEIKTKEPIGNILNGNDDLNNSNTQAKRPKFECAICMEAVDNKEISSVPCGHTFCSPCIKNALEKNKRCPSCSTPANTGDLRRTFLPM